MQRDRYFMKSNISLHSLNEMADKREGQTDELPRLGSPARSLAPAASDQTRLSLPEQGARWSKPLDTSMFLKLPIDSSGGSVQTLPPHPPILPPQ